MDIQIRNKEPSISIVAPVFNEEENLPSFIKSLDNYLSEYDNKNFELNVVFYNDGSSDNSLEILKKTELILCEDTRKIKYLLNHYKIPLNKKYIIVNKNNENKPQTHSCHN